MLTPPPPPPPYTAHYSSRRYDYDHDVDFDFLGFSTAGEQDNRFRIPLGPGDRIGIVLFVQQLESLFLQLCGFRRDHVSGVLEMYPTTEGMFAAGVGPSLFLCFFVSLFLSFPLSLLPNSHGTPYAQVRGLGALACVSGMPRSFFSFLRVVMEYEMNFATSVLFPFACDPGRSAVDRAARRVAWACQIALDSSGVAAPLEAFHKGSEREPCARFYFRKPKWKKSARSQRRRNKGACRLRRGIVSYLLLIALAPAITDGSTSRCSRRRGSRTRTPCERLSREVVAQASAIICKYGVCRVLSRS